MRVWASCPGRERMVTIMPAVPLGRADKVVGVVPVVPITSIASTPALLRPRRRKVGPDGRRVMDVRPTHSRWHATLLAAAVALAGGCVHTKGGPVTPPPAGSVPTELNPIILPRYVISPPDVLYIQVLQPPYNHYLPSKEE